MWQLYNILLSFHSINAGEFKELRLSNYACTQGNHPWLTLNMTQRYTNLWTKTYPMPACSGYGSIRNSTISTSSRDSRIGSCSTQWHVFEEQSSAITEESTYHNTESTEEECLSASHKCSLLIQILCQENDHLHSMKILKLSRSAKPKWSQKMTVNCFNHDACMQVVINLTNTLTIYQSTSCHLSISVMLN